MAFVKRTEIIVKSSDMIEKRTGIIERNSDMIEKRAGTIEKNSDMIEKRSDSANKCNNGKQIYQGFTLLEMTLTIAIIAIVILLISTTLTTMIKNSINTNSALQTREETELVFEYLTKNIKQSDPSNIVFFASGGARNYNDSLGKTVENQTSRTANAYANPLPVGNNPADPIRINEIHFLPSGAKRWLCLGFFTDLQTGKGYILKSSMGSVSGADGHKACFDSTKSDYRKNTMVLNSREVNINDFSIKSYAVTSENAMLLFDISAIPMNAYSTENPTAVTRQLVVSTNKMSIW